MMNDDVTIREAVPDDLHDISLLHRELFGPGRFARTAYRIREDAGGPAFGLVARMAQSPGEAGAERGRLIGSVHFTGITIGGRSGALLLGPLAVAAAYKSRGHGMALVGAGLSRARQMGVAIVILVGDLAYYSRMGFAPVAPARIMMPGPSDPARLLAAELDPGTLTTFTGQVRGAPEAFSPGEMMAPPALCACTAAPAD